MSTVVIAGRPACLACGYDLSGLALRGRCPECGDGYVLRTSTIAPAPKHQRIRSVWWWPLLAISLKSGALAALVLGIGAVVVLFGWGAIDKLNDELWEQEMESSEGVCSM